MRRTLLALAIVGCGGGDKDLATPDACNPLGGSACVTPWPSSIYEMDDATTETGRHLDIPAGALPKNYDGIEVNPALLNGQDGFSSAAPLLIAFPGGVDPSNLPSFHDFTQSLADTSPTVLIDMSTGELVPHWAELDVRAADDPANQALYIRSAAMLKRGTRYVAAIKKTLHAKDGSPLPVSDGFQALVDGDATTHPLLEKVRPRYAEIFAALAAHGIAKEDLVVAWDFTTRSRTQVQADLLDARTATLAALGDGTGFGYTVLSSSTPGDTRYAKQINGTYEAPLFMQSTSTRTAASVQGTVGSTPVMTLARDASGKPMVVGKAAWPFTAMIPQCAIDATTPVPVILYGHGLLGKAEDQVPSGGPRNAGAEVCAVVIGTDMFGMSEQDVPGVALALNDGNDGPLIFDALVQGMMNHVSLVQITRSVLRDAPDVFAKAGGGSLIDPDRIYYYGISQGGIMGGTVCAIDPVIQRCVLQVNGINYSILLERSADWPRYRTPLVGAFDTALEVTLMINLMQNEWDRTEPTAVADVLAGEGFPGSPPKQVFMQVGLGDTQVPNLGSEYQARTMNIPVILPTPYTPYGVTTTSQPASSGVLYYDFGVASTVPDTNEAPPDNDVHGQLRNKTLTQQMIKHFYETGEIVNMCTAPTGCDCTQGGCGTNL